MIHTCVGRDSKDKNHTVTLESIFLPILPMGNTDKWYPACLHVMIRLD